MSITAGTYKETPAVILENESLRAAVLPGRGSKMASLVYKPLDEELLWQNPESQHAPARYGASYGANEATGFDEMFPTISRCYYDGFPWAGTEMPDHGEVWSLRWEHAIAPDHVAMQVRGVRFPYLFKKQVSLADGRVHIRYQATNLSDYDFDFIWAAHPLFRAAQGMQIVVPPGMNRIVNSVAGLRLKEYGKTHTFPVAELEDGTRLNLGVVPRKNDYGYQKYYFLGPATEGWCLLHDPARRLSIRLSFPVETVPYLGLWLNEGGWHGQYNIAPEPATAAMDRVDAAKLWGTGSVLKAHETRQWHLDIEVFEGERSVR
jgi:galactose mutarotase-like enzyme